MTRGHVREVIVSAKVELIDQMLARIESLPLQSLEAFVGDVNLPAAGESYLRRALEALLDLARHVLAKGFGVPAAEYKEIPRKLGELGVLEAGATALLTEMAGYRNRLVHFYDEVKVEELFHILSEKKGDVRSVLTELLEWMDEHPERVERSP